jgi:hypothetical protein
MIVAKPVRIFENYKPKPHNDQADCNEKQNQSPVLDEIQQPIAPCPCIV